LRHKGLRDAAGKPETFKTVFWHPEISLYS